MKLKSQLLIAVSIPTLAFAQNYQTQYLPGTYWDQAYQYDIGGPQGLAEYLLEGRLPDKKEEVENRKGVRVIEKKVEVEGRKDQVANNLDKMTSPMPDATMASPVPPVSSSVNSQMPASYPGRPVAAQPGVGIPPPTIRAEIPGQVGQSAIPQPAVGMPPPTIRSEISAPGHIVPPPRVEHQMQGGAPAVNVGPGPLNPSIGR